MFFAHHQIDAEDGTAGRAQGGRQREAVHRRIAVDPDQDVVDLGGGGDDLLDVIRVVHARQVLHARLGCVIVRHQHLHARGDKAVLNGKQALRALGMVGAHLVLLTSRMRNEGEVH
jgi:hypothetical protein